MALSRGIAAGVAGCALHFAAEYLPAFRAWLDEDMDDGEELDDVSVREVLEQTHEVLFAGCREPLKFPAPLEVMPA